MTVHTDSPRTLRLMTVLLLVATFVLGAAAGAGASRWLAPDCTPASSDGRPPFGPWPLRQLHLSPEQEAKVQDILERHRPELDAILRESFPQVRAIHEEIDREIGEVLTEAQRAELARLKARWPFPPGGPLPPGPPGSTERLPPFPSDRPAP
jgi:Spy/CpxP family protein refolding chaperone